MGSRSVIKILFFPSSSSVTVISLYVCACLKTSVFLFLPLSFVSMLSEVWGYHYFEKSAANWLHWAQSKTSVPSSINRNRKFPISKDWCFYRTGGILSVVVKKKIMLNVIQTQGAGCINKVQMVQAVNVQGSIGDYDGWEQK